MSYVFKLINRYLPTTSRYLSSPMIGILLHLSYIHTLPSPFLPVQLQTSIFHLSSFRYFLIMIKLGVRYIHPPPDPGLSPGRDQARLGMGIKWEWDRGKEGRGGWSLGNIRGGGVIYEGRARVRVRAGVGLD